MSGSRNRLVEMLIGLIVVTSLSGCSAAFSPERLPTAAGMRDGWTMYIRFGTVMNLPNQSKVVVDGIDAGVVSDIRPDRDAAVAKLTINSGVVVGAKAIAELRQDTLLGDTYVSLANPSDAYSHPLASDATLGPGQVKAPVQIEDLFVSLSNFLGGGALPELGNSFAKVNAQFPDDPAEVRRLTATFTETLTAWGDNIGDLNVTLQQLTEMTSTLAKYSSTLSFALSPPGMTQVKGLTDPRLLGDLVVGLSRGLRPMVPAIPLLKSLTRLIDSVVIPYLVPGWPQYAGQDSNATRLVDLLTNKVIPYLKNIPAVNIRSVAIEGGVSDRQLADRLVKVFRTMGMVR
ncbi:Mce family protein [Gordonia effusa NBRC 100432]|uniref:Mce family protein n=1 Tax=Gordonia effusa NBRC 100432 TaxID=1077974 RepID=H0QYS0_9ACTN|nr:MlaD family protein [Gordonia effusa]GAB17971.1 Mce family protein [Gordonia effusa NBRC 100432]